MKNIWKAISMIGMLVMLSTATMTTATARTIKLQARPMNSMEIYHPYSLAIGYVCSPGFGSNTESDSHTGFNASVEAWQENYPHSTAYSKEFTEGSQLSNGFRIHQKELQFIMQEPLNDSTQACGVSQTNVHFKIHSAQPTVTLQVSLEYYSNLFANSNCLSEGVITLRYYDQSYSIQEITYNFSGNIVQQDTLVFNLIVPNTFDGFFELRTRGSVETGLLLQTSYAGSWVETTLSVTIA
ncbi:MAG: hypothetical protein V1726_05115 [Methanobacteriota archaeon]